MTITEPPATTTEPGVAKALFPEARQRRRRIRLTIGAVLIVVAATAAGLLYATGGHGPPPTGPPPSSGKGQPSDAASPASSAGPSMSNRFPGGQSLPAGAEVTSVVQFHGHHVAAGAYLSGSAVTPSACSASGCNPMVWTSSNGKQWIPTWGSAPSGSVAGEILVVAPTALLLFNDDEGTGLWRSTNAISWNEVPLPSGMAALGVRGAVWGHGRYVAILNNKYAGGPDTAYGESDTIWTSTNGTTWTPDPVAGSRLAFSSLDVDATGFAVRGTANGSTAEWTSPNGIAWTIKGRT